MAANPRALNAPRRVRALELDVQVLDLRTRGLSFPAIAQRLGCSKSGAQKALARALDRSIDRISERAPEIRAEEAAKLDAAAQAILPRVLEGDARAQDTWLRNRQRYASLLGLDLKPPDVTIDQSQNVIVLPAWGEQPQAVDGEAQELEPGDAP